MEEKMKLNKQQKDILDGARGPALAKVMQTLVRYGEIFGADKMVPVSGKMGHLVTSFGLGVLKPVYALLDELIAGGALSSQPFTVDPRPLDGKIRINQIQKLLFNLMYSKQEDYELQLRKLGLKNERAFTCTCYMKEVGNIPRKGDVLSWAESSAVVYANSVLGARCNRNSGIIELFGSVAGFVPSFGLLTDKGRKASWVIRVKTTTKPEAQLLGSAIGMKVMEDVPYIVGLDKWLGKKLNDDVKDYLKDMGAASASNGAVGLFHVEGLTPEAVESGKKLVLRGAKEYIIDDDELERVRESYPCIWKNPDAKPKLAFVGCPHLSLAQLKMWTRRIEERGAKVKMPTVMTASSDVIAAFEKTDYAERLRKTGVVLSYICPLMFMNNPLCGKIPVVTNSNKLRTYTSARYFSDDHILDIIIRGDF